METQLTYLTPKKDKVVCEVALFDKAGLDNALNILGWKEKNSILVDSNGKEVTCGVCGEKLSQHKISSFFPGSVKAVCKKPECFIIAIYKTKQKMES